MTDVTTSEDITFLGTRGQALSGVLSLPAGTPRAFAVFAHCFTCGKDSHAAARISRALAERGIGVLRFDFTGLGESGGDFADTTFSCDVSDLTLAADHLAATYRAPSLLVGHSLGGAAVLAAAEAIPSVRAVVTGGPEGDWSTAFRFGPGEIPQEADTTISIHHDDAEALARRELEPLAAFLAGRIAVAGDMLLVMQLQAIVAGLGGGGDS